MGLGWQGWSLRWKLVLGSALIEIVMLALLVVNNVRLIEDSLHHQFELRLRELSVLLNAAIAPEMAERDYGPMQGIFAQSLRKEGIVYFALFDKSGKQVAGNGWPVGRPLPKVQQRVDIRGDELRFDTEIPVAIGGQSYGRLQFGISTEFLHQARARLVRQSLAIAAVEVVLSIVLLVLLAIWLTRHLAKLEAASIAVGQGDFDVAVRIESSDEIGRVAEAFNRMTREIKARLSELGSSEARFRALIERAPDAIVVVDVDAQRIVEANPQVEKLFDRSRQDILSGGVDRFYTPIQPTGGTVADGIREVQRRALSGESVVIERRLRNSSGRELIAEVRVDDISDGHHRRVRASYTDITERKRAESALSESEAFLLGIFNNAAEGIWVIDTERRTVRANHALCKMLAINEQDIRGRSIYAFVDDDNAAIFRARSAITQETGHGTSYEVEMTSCIGGKINCLFNSSPLRDSGGAIVGSFAVVNDITSRKAIEDELRKIKERYDVAAMIGKVGTWDWNPITGALVWNDETFRLMGFEPGSVVPGYELFLGLVHVDDREHLATSVRKALLDNEPYSVDCRIVRGNGGEIDCHVTGKVEFDESDRPIRMLGTINDITERKQAEVRQQLAASVFTHAREGIVITDAAGAIIDVNDTFTHITGYSREEIIGQNPSILKSGRQGPDFYAAMWQSLVEKGHWYGEVWNRNKSGHLYAELINITAVRDSAGKTQHYVALFTDITSMKEHQQQLEHIAHYDALTGQPNRVLLADRLHQTIAQARRRESIMALVYLDLDGFKAVNDRHGHETGDRLLIAVAHCLKEVLREGDTLARLGGDEFVAVLSDLATVTECESVLARLLSAAATPVQIGDLTLQVSASLGVTLFPLDDADADSLLRHADQAMYMAKQAGKNRYHLFDVEHDAAVKTRHESLERIRLALDQREFVLYYQPKVNMKTGTVIGAEALIRWQHPERGLLPPSDFLSVVEDHAIGVELGEWVIEAALTQMSEWRAAGLDITVSVNVGARQLQQEDFVVRLSAQLAAHPEVKAGELELEILETSALEDVTEVSELMYACLELGVSFALDDFGTGYSSLTYLKRLPANLLKIDQSFVLDMIDDPDDMAIVQGVIGLAKAFGRQVIAEGVETVAHGALLLPLGCELAQGYGIARPMPAADLPGWVTAWRPDVSWTA